MLFLGRPAFLTMHYYESFVIIVPIKFVEFLGALLVLSYFYGDAYVRVERF